MVSLQKLLAEMALAVAQRADGARCDMAMLLLDNVFDKTWGDDALPTDVDERVRGTQIDR